MRRENDRRVKHSDETIAYIIDHYPNENTNDVAAAVGLPVRIVRHIAGSRGVRKSRDFIKFVRNTRGEARAIEEQRRRMLAAEQKGKTRTDAMEWPLWYQRHGLAPAVYR